MRRFPLLLPASDIPTGEGQKDRAEAPAGLNGEKETGPGQQHVGAD